MPTDKCGDVHRHNVSHVLETPGFAVLCLATRHGRVILIIRVNMDVAA